MASLFEGYERRIDQINAVLNSYGISSIEEAEKITKDAGLNVYDQVKKIQPICFENACWAYTVGAAIAIKKGCKRAADAAAAIGEGLQAFCIPGSVADHRKVGLGHGNLGKMLLEEETECFCFLAGHESFAAAEGAIGIAEKANKVRKKPLRVILNGLGKDAAQIISRINGFTYVETEMDYYTGVMFRGYIGGAGAAILSGGRYNALCAKFGKDMPAGGFGIDVESVAESLQGARRPEAATRRDTVRIALTKGRLEKKTLALLKAAGYDISELEAGSRKLIFTLPDTGVEIVLAKAADVITYVEHGVCDMGVVGKDTIMEKGGSFYEMVDLGFGKCRFALATKKGKDVYGGYKTPVIATKYPAVTKAFFNRKNMDVETIKIEGSVELAPLLELADAIVDIVETGTTLKENGLEVIEDVAPISARVIVNLASAKMKKTAIQKVIFELESGLEG